jgi:glycosyltransferase 2 family protein
MPRNRVILLLFLFTLLTTGGIQIASKYADLDLREVFSQVHFGWHHVIWIIVLNIGVYLFDSARYYFLSIAVNQKLSFKLCFEAVIANLFFAWITPGSALGAPAAAYILNKKGVKLSHAITISFGRSTSLMFTATIIAVSIIFSGVELPFPQNSLMNAIYGIVTLLSLITFFLFGFSLINYPKYIKVSSEPTRMNKIKKGLISILDRISYLLKNAKLLIIPIGLSSLMFQLCFIGLLIVFSLEFNATKQDAILMPLLYMTYSLFLPTPGGSGLAEVTAESFFKLPISSEQALAMVIIARIFTYAVQISIGVIYFFFILKFKKIEFLKESTNE